jgi:hypothetical protein
MRISGYAPRGAPLPLVINRRRKAGGDFGWDPPGHLAARGGLSRKPMIVANRSSETGLETCRNTVFPGLEQIEATRVRRALRLDPQRS